VQKVQTVWKKQKVQKKAKKVQKKAKSAKSVVELFFSSDPQPTDAQKHHLFQQRLRQMDLLVNANRPKQWEQVLKAQHLFKASSSTNHLAPKFEDTNIFQDFFFNH
jgi:hypothetical protein